MAAAVVSLGVGSSRGKSCTLRSCNATVVRTWSASHGRQDLVGNLVEKDGVTGCIAVFVTGIVDGYRALGVRARARLFGGRAGALLARLGEVVRRLRFQHVVVGFGNDRHFERNRLGKRVADDRIEGNADNQDAVDQRGQKQHGWQSVRVRAGFQDERFDRSQRIHLINV